MLQEYDDAKKYSVTHLGIALVGCLTLDSVEMSMPVPWLPSGPLGPRAVAPLGAVPMSVLTMTVLSASLKMPTRKFPLTTVVMEGSVLPMVTPPVDAADEKRPPPLTTWIPNVFDAVVEPSALSPMMQPSTVATAGRRYSPDP